MQIRICVLIMAALIFVFPACKPKEKEALMTVQSTFGQVQIASASGERAPQPGDALAQGDTIITGKSSLMDILYGTRGVIRINENTHIKLSTLLAEGDKEQARMEIDRGKVFITVSKLTKGSTMEIVSPTTIAAVRGTSFRVTADENSSRIDVLSGKINVNPVKEGKVVEGAEKVVETNNAVVVDTKTVEAIIEKKKEIEVVILKPAELEEIRDEVKDMKPAEKLDESTKQEFREVVLEVKDGKAAEKKKEEEELLLKEKKEKEAKDKSARLEKARAEKERLEMERVEKERIEKERRDKELAEKKKQETKEQRVKNIPNL